MTLRVGDSSQTAEVQAGGGYLSQWLPPLSFGAEDGAPRYASACAGQTRRHPASRTQKPLVIGFDAQR